MHSRKEHIGDQHWFYADHRYLDARILCAQCLHPILSRDRIIYTDFNSVAHALCPHLRKPK